jgi:hypothetical protein
MNRFLIKFILFFIPIRSIRRAVKGYLSDFSLLGMLSSPYHALKIYQMQLAQTNVVLLELNKFHAECLYSIYYYFKKLKYKPVIFTVKENIELNLFCGEEAKIIMITPWIIKILDFFGYFGYVFVPIYDSKHVITNISIKKILSK